MCCAWGRSRGRNLRSQSPHPKLARFASLGWGTRSECLQFFEEAADGFDPAVEVRDVELLVGSVEIIVGEAEAHHHAGNLQHVLEVRNDWDRATAADKDRVFLERIVQRLGCS